ncbi:hypothetical protein FISHEDRAFT_69268 [Fistulina hepatica ATCC 64428]|uniref:Zn(2)-C6 fungal-type domain-containing protein n=1 Tax=Fistulina hepatica ATCC 64428 TaxID=1128425 RepID=A0A0D7AMN6_9AGAR|nr:hypothetical protein FISHEDRAFT_69268 [Fistulina hepatica ATCC 64428]
MSFADAHDAAHMHQWRAASHHHALATEPFVAHGGHIFDDFSPNPSFSSVNHMPGLHRQNLITHGDFDPPFYMQGPRSHVAHHSRHQLYSPPSFEEMPPASFHQPQGWNSMSHGSHVSSAYNSFPDFPAAASFPGPRLEPPSRLGFAGSLDPSTGIFYRTPEHPRLRTAQACEKCRIRKAKCSGDHPSCKRCLTRGLTCEYAKEGRSRGAHKSKPKTSITISTSGGQLIDPAQPLSASTGSPPAEEVSPVLSPVHQNAEQLTRPHNSSRQRSLSLSDSRGSTLPSLLPSDPPSCSYTMEGFYAGDVSSIRTSSTGSPSHTLTPELDVAPLRVGTTGHASSGLVQPEPLHVPTLSMHTLRHFPLENTDALPVQKILPFTTTQSTRSVEGSSSHETVGHFDGHACHDRLVYPLSPVIASETQMRRAEWSHVLDGQRPTENWNRFPSTAAHVLQSNASDSESYPYMEYHMA